MVAHDPSKQRWLLSVGILPILSKLLDIEQELKVSEQRISQENSSTISGPMRVNDIVPSSTKISSATSDTSLIEVNDRSRLDSRDFDDKREPLVSISMGSVTESGLTRQPRGNDDIQSVNQEKGDSKRDALVCIERQIYRLVAMLSIQKESNNELSKPQWTQRLERTASLSDCKLSSHATRALLHLQIDRCDVISSLPLNLFMDFIFRVVYADNCLTKSKWEVRLIKEMNCGLICFE